MATVDPLVSALSSIARVVATTLDLTEVFGSVAKAAASVLPFDVMYVERLEGPDALSLYSFAGGENLDEPRTARLADFSPALLPRHLPGVLRTDDLAQVVDVSYLADRSVLQHGWRSSLLAPMRRAHEVVGYVWLGACRTHAFTADHEAALCPIVEMLALALEHERLAQEQRLAVEARERAAQLEVRVEALREELEASRGCRRVLGESQAWQEVLTLAAKVAPTETTVLLAGESGTGKEVVARLIHRGSPRARGPFVALNCAALPETLLESELFGHERGAFTGAVAARPGRIEQAAGGVLFLDEVAEMSPAVQAKLLRVLQEREFQRLGGARSQKADVRVLAATNRDLEAALARGLFREDLYYRLRVFEIRLPPLRERRRDILPMAEAFLAEIGPAVGRAAAGLSRHAREALQAYRWPGNVRELRNVLERASILCDGGPITVEHLPVEVGRGQPAMTGRAFPPGGLRLERMERDLIAQTLQETRNNRSRAARLLGISRSQLYSKIQKHGLDTAAADLALPQA